MCCSFMNYISMYVCVPVVVDNCSLKYSQRIVMETANIL